MADEPLGHIDIRFPTTAAGGAASDTPARQAASSIQTALANVLKNVGSYKSVLSTGAQGGSVGEIVSGAKSAASSAGGGAFALAGGAMVAGLAVVAASLYSIKAGTDAIKNRVSELAKVDSAMAFQTALNTLQEMKQDMKEAQLLGPIYESVMEAYRAVQEGLQPILLIVKALMGGIIGIALEAISSILEFLQPVIRDIAKGIGSILSSVIENKDYYTGLLLGIISSILPSFIANPMIAAGSKQSDAFKLIEKMSKTLLGISDMVHTATTAQGSNAHFKDMLNALAGARGAGNVARTSRGLPQPTH
jgi:phage-related protein